MSLIQDGGRFGRYNRLHKPVRKRDNHICHNRKQTRIASLTFPFKTMF